MLNFLNFSKIIFLKYCRLKFYFYLTQFLKYFSFILYTSKYFYNWLGPPLAPAWPPPLNISSGYGPDVYMFIELRTNMQTTTLEQTCLRTNRQEQTACYRRKYEHSLIAQFRFAQWLKLRNCAKRITLSQLRCLLIAKLRINKWALQYYCINMILHIIFLL